MKTFPFVLTFALLPCAASFAQTAVFDLNVFNALNNVNNNVSALNGNMANLGGKIDSVNNSVNSLGGKLDAQLAAINRMSDQQLEQLKKMVTALEDTAKDIHDTVGKLGDPGAEQSGHFDDMENSIKDLKNNHKFVDTKFYDSNITSPNDPTKAFSATGDGLLASSIGDKFVYYNPDTKANESISRNKDLYRLPVASLSAVRDYYEVRKNALSRRDALQGLLADTLNELQHAQNFAQVTKLGPLVEVIWGQIQSCNHDINTAYNDLVARGLQVYALNSIKSTADLEPQTYQSASKNKKLADTMDQYTKQTLGLPTAGGSAIQLDKTGSYFPWYSDPSSGSASTPAGVGQDLKAMFDNFINQAGSQMSGWGK